MTFPRGYYIALFLMFIGLVAFGQDCCEFDLLRRDTILKASSISVIEVPQGKQARLTFEDMPVITIVNSFDNLDTQVEYLGTWNNGPTTASGFTNNTIAWSAVRGSTFSFTFTGKKLEWLSEYKSTHGRAEISIDGTVQYINLAKENSGPGIVAEWSWPTSATRTINIKVFDHKAVVHDGFRVTN
jgi:hypothetical protein